MSTTHYHHHLNGANTNELLKCKKSRMNFTKMAYGSSHPVLPTSVARRNERERNRVKMVNMGFATLRQHVPNGAKNKKMSKVETLRSAVEYIRQLQKVLGQNSDPSAFLSEQFGNSLQVPSTSGDENCYPVSMNENHLNTMLSPTNMDGQHLTYQSQMSYTTMAGSMYSTSPTSDMSGKVSEYGILNSSSSPIMAPSSRDSPSPSIASDISSSQYDNQSLLDANPTSNSQPPVSNEDELFDFCNWF